MIVWMFNEHRARVELTRYDVARLGAHMFFSCSLYTFRISFSTNTIIFLPIDTIYIKPISIEV